MIEHYEQLASKHPALVLLQETHCHDAEKLMLPGFALAGATLSMKHMAWLHLCRSCPGAFLVNLRMIRILSG